MIKLIKEAIPDVLIENATKWTAILVARQSAGETATETELGRYRHKEIKRALLKETHKKCAYCESFLTHIAYGDVEHIVAKSADLHNYFEWSNLTLACDKCNTKKGRIEDLIDPYKDNPEEILTFLGPAVIPNEKNMKAVLTVRALGLNRLDLIERRMQKIQYLSDQMIILHTAPPSLKAVIERDLRENETAASQEFAAVARSFIKLKLKDLID